MKSLVAALKKHKDDLPTDLQNLVKEVSVRSGQEETKQLHSAVSQHGRAKKEVSDAQSARLHMHLAWKNFLAQSVKQWSSYTSQFMAQEKQLLERLKQAQDALAAAKHNLGACKGAAGLSDDANMISDDEAEPKDTVEIAGQKIAASFKDLASSLETLHTQAEQAVQMEEEQDQLRKRPRTSEPGSAETVSKDAATPPHFGAPE